MTKSMQDIPCQKFVLSKKGGPQSSPK